MIGWVFAYAGWMLLWLLVTWFWVLLSRRRERLEDEAWAEECTPVWTVERDEQSRAWRVYKDGVFFKRLSDYQPMQQQQGPPLWQVQQAGGYTRQQLGLLQQPWQGGVYPARQGLLQQPWQGGVYPARQGLLGGLGSLGLPFV